MSIIIHGIDMPEHCGKCKLKVVYDDETFCPFFTDNVEYWIAARRRHEDCPLDPVPPHGRLIDADALGKVMCEGIAPSVKDGGFRHPFDIIRAVANAPTIIPASKEDK